MPHLIFGKYITFFTSLIAVLVLYLVLSVPSRVQAAAAFGGSGSGSVFSCLPQSLVTSGARNVPFRSTCRAFFYSSHSRFLLFLHSSCLLITTARHRRKHSSAAPRSDSRLLLNAAPRRLLIYSPQAFSHTRTRTRPVICTRAPFGRPRSQSQSIIIINHAMPYFSAASMLHVLFLSLGCHQTPLLRASLRAAPGALMMRMRMERALSSVLSCLSFRGRRSTHLEPMQHPKTMLH